MSLISKIWKGMKSVVLPAAGYALGGPIGGAIGGMLGGGGQGAPAAVGVSQPSSGALMKIPTGTTMGSRTLPGVGAIGAGLAGAAAGAAGTYFMNAQGQMVKKRRRRRRGISASELKNHARVENFLSKNFKCKSGGSRPSYVKRKR